MGKKCRKSCRKSKRDYATAAGAGAWNDSNGGSGFEDGGLVNISR